MLGKMPQPSVVDVLIRKFSEASEVFPPARIFQVLIQRLPPASVGGGGDNFLYPHGSEGGRGWVFLVTITVARRDADIASGRVAAGLPLVGTIQYLANEAQPPQRSL